MRRERKNSTVSSEFDPELILQRARRLDSNALISLHDHYFPQVYRYARFRLEDQRASEEVAGDVFLQFLEAINQRRAPRRNPAGWLFRRAAESVEQRQTHQTGGKPRPTSASPSSVDQAISRVPPEQAHYVGLRFSQERSLPEVARLLGRSEPQCRLLQLQALSGLSAAMGKDPSKRRDEGLARALEVCLQRLDPKTRPEDLARSFPKWREALTPLLEAARAACTAGGAELPEAARQLSQTEFLQVARRMIPKPHRPRLEALGRLGAALFALAALLAVVAWAATSLSDSALPGDPHYFFKRLGEQARLSLTQDPGRRLSLIRRYDERRREEVEGLLQLGRPGAVEFSGTLGESLADAWLVGGMRVQVPGNAQVLGDIQPGYLVSVEGEITPDGTLVGQRLKMREVALLGILESVSASRLIIDGLEILLTPETVWIGDPAPGSRVRVVVRLPTEGPPEARLVEATG